MKRLVLLLAVMGTTLALAAGMALAQATTDTFVVKQPFNKTLFNPCTGEEVQFTGDILFLYRETRDPNGGFHIEQHTSGAGVTGTGESGTQYRLVGVARQGVYFAPGETREATSVQSLRLVSNGSSDNYVLVTQIHVTFNANGEPTVVLFREDIECVG